MSEQRVQQVGDLEVFRRAYVLSLELHRASLESADRAVCAGGSAPPVVETDLR